MIANLRRRLRACTWTALVVFGAMALAPVLAQAMASPLAGWAAVCTAQGLERVAVGDMSRDLPGDPGAPSRPAHPGHCPLCSTAAGLAPPAPALPLPAGQATDPRPLVLARITRPGPWWPGTAVRAPPAVAPA